MYLYRDMYKRISVISLLIVLSFQTIFLPQMNVSLVAEFPEMYRLCKMQEDKDMSLVDFFKDHVFNVDSLFDTHENDDQKPHEPRNYFQHAGQVFFIYSQVIVHTLLPPFKSGPVNCYTDDLFHTVYLSGIFKPPLTNG